MLILRSSGMPLMRASDITYLTEQQLNDLTKVFQEYYDSKNKKAQKKNRGRYWLAYLILRFTGARLGEVISIDDRVDIDFRNYDIKLLTLKQKPKKNKKPSRIVPVPPNVTSEIASEVLCPIL